MTRAMKCLLGTAFGTAALAITAATASADVACSGNVCWHVKERHTYPREGRVVIHRDTWKPGPRIEFREHEGRGYWRDGNWVDF